MKWTRPLERMLDIAVALWLLDIFFRRGSDPGSARGYAIANGQEVGFEIGREGPSQGSPVRRPTNWFPA